MKNILIDTILYNPMTYIFNVDMNNLTADIYDSVDDKIRHVTIKDNLSGTYILHKGNYYHLHTFFDITEKQWGRV